MRQQIRLFFFVCSITLIGHEAKACSCEYLNNRIDSLSQLKSYDFIAHVKIVDDLFYDGSAKNGDMGKLNIQIIELFKGKKESYVLEYSKGTSCDMGISKGEEWILFAQITDGKMSIFPCDLNQLYKAENGMRDWKYETGFYELTQLKKLYKHPIINHKDGLHEEWYANGQKEIEETYLDGRRNGVRKIWFPNGVLFCKQTFFHDTLTGKSEWFYSSGQLRVEEFYMMGKRCNTYRAYFDTTINESNILESIDKLNVPDETMKSKPKEVQVKYEVVFNSSGKAILNKQYCSSGKLLKEETFIPEQSFSTIIQYYENGSVNSIGYQLNGVNYGHYQEFDIHGYLKRSWEYDEDGNVIKSE
ncbi:MAG: hypothetical protein RLZZ30_1162 [Bacteroidota bacterium]|jgi:antitoxin component YwqK of YwqJK toxin-antitoxin module